MSSYEKTLLGARVDYPVVYAPDCLFPIARKKLREQLGIAESLPFYGVDIWNAYEMSWLNQSGKPQVAIGVFSIPADSPNLIESKSLKLYLNSLIQSRFETKDEILRVIKNDLSVVAGASVEVLLKGVDDRVDVFSQSYLSLDNLEINVHNYGPPQPDFLLTASGCEIQESLSTRLFKSNCPVTGQPDWASVYITYTGQRIDHAGLLRYLISFRQHSDFHEHCVERIYRDLIQYCQPRMLDVYARYTRRGGLDINPFRSSHQAQPPHYFDPRQ
jgi:7-cyano-7-deazaguanine reductase